MNVLATIGAAGKNGFGSNPMNHTLNTYALKSCGTEKSILGLPNFL